MGRKPASCMIGKGKGGVQLDSGNFLGGKVSEETGLLILEMQLGFVLLITRFIAFSMPL